MLLQTKFLPVGYKIFAQMDYIFPNQKLFIIVSDTDLVFLEKKPSPYPDEEDEPGGMLLFQTEFPRAAAAWIVDVVENRLWKSGANGGQPSGVNFVDENVAGENLKIRRSMNVSGPGEKGFYFINFSRKSLNFEMDDFQEIQITDKLLTDGLLDVLKQIKNLG